jgi:hypothetical protein
VFPREEPQPVQELKSRRVKEFKRRREILAKRSSLLLFHPSSDHFNG